jgi:hypothetical protein
MFLINHTDLTLFRQWCYTMNYESPRHQRLLDLHTELESKYFVPLEEIFTTFVYSFIWAYYLTTGFMCRLPPRLFNMMSRHIINDYDITTMHYQADNVAALFHMINKGNPNGIGDFLDDTYCTVFMEPLRTIFLEAMTEQG